MQQCPMYSDILFFDALQLDAYQPNTVYQQQHKSHTLQKYHTFKPFNAFTRGCTFRLTRITNLRAKQIAMCDLAYRQPHVIDER